MDSCGVNYRFTYLLSECKWMYMFRFISRCSFLKWRRTGISSHSVEACERAEVGLNAACSSFVSLLNSHRTRTSNTCPFHWSCCVRLDFLADATAWAVGVYCVWWITERISPSSEILEKYSQILLFVVSKNSIQQISSAGTCICPPTCCVHAWKYDDRFSHFKVSLKFINSASNFF